MEKELISPRKTKSLNWRGVTSFVVDKQNEVVRVNAVKTTGKNYRTITLTKNNKLNVEYSEEKLGKYRPVGVASLCTDPREGPDKVFEIFSDDKGEEWFSNELTNEI
jgi:hypothetical protein